MLVDRLMDYGATATGSATTTTFGTTPTLGRYVTGEGVKAFAEVTQLLGGTGATVQINYTNQDGVSNRTSLVATLGNSTVGGLQTGGMFLGLQGTDTGVRSVESITIGGTPTTGYVTIVLCRPVMMLPAQANAYIERDMLLQTPRPFQSLDGSAYQWLFMSGAGTSGTFMGMLSVVEP
jgi:hypothetical protein